MLLHGIGKHMAGIVAWTWDGVNKAGNRRAQHPPFYSNNTQVTTLSRLRAGRSKNKTGDDGFGSQSDFQDGAMARQSKIRAAKHSVVIISAGACSGFTGGDIESACGP